MTAWNKACRIRKTNNPEEKSTHDEFGRLLYAAFMHIYNSVKWAKKFWYLGIFPLNLGNFTQDFIHAYLEMANTEDHVRENGLLGILPPSAEVITNVHPAPNVTRNANLTSEGSFFSCTVMFFPGEALLPRKKKTVKTAINTEMHSDLITFVHKKNLSCKKWERSDGQVKIWKKARDGESWENENQAPFLSVQPKEVFKSYYRIFWSNISLKNAYNCLFRRFHTPSCLPFRLEINIGLYFKNSDGMHVLDWSGSG